MKILHIIIAFCAGLFLGDCFRPKPSASQPPGQDFVQEAQKNIDQVDAAKHQADSLLQKRNDFLSSRLNTVNAILAIHKEKLARQREEIMALTSRIKNDTGSGHLLGDSLADGILGLNKSTDSIVSDYEHRIRLTENRLAVRDSELVVCAKSYVKLKDVIMEQSLREQKLQEDLATALRQVKRRRMQNKFLAGGMLFISGITTSLIVKSRQ